MNEKHCTLLFLRKDNQILLAMKKRGFGEGRYNGVGGKIESGETLTEALVRECEEEIGVTPLSYEPVAEFNFYGEGDSFRMHVYVYFCNQWKGEPIETEEMAPAWYAVNEIPYEQMWPDDILWLPKTLEGKKLSGQFSFDKNDAVVSHILHEVTQLPHEQIGVK
jgi:mutator protein MutT